MENMDHCFNSNDPNAREKNYDIGNLDVYYKFKRMKEDMDQSIEIHKLRKECKELIRSSTQTKSPSPKNWSTGVKGWTKEVKLDASIANKH